MMFLDSLYYFPPDFQPQHNAMVYVAGGNFFPQRGRYQLPLHEGFYEVIPDPAFNDF